MGRPGPGRVGVPAGGFSVMAAMVGRVRPVRSGVSVGPALSAARVALAGLAATAGWCSAMVGLGAWVVAAASAAPAAPAAPAGVVVRGGPAAWVGLGGW